MNEKELNVANSFLNEVETEESGLVKIYYSDLDLNARKKILEAINDTNEYIDVFTDDIVKAKIEEQFDSKPLFTITGEEIVNNMNFDF